MVFGLNVTQTNKQIKKNKTKQNTKQSKQKQTTKTKQKTTKTKKKQTEKQTNKNKTKQSMVKVYLALHCNLIPYCGALSNNVEDP